MPERSIFSPTGCVTICATMVIATGLIPIVGCLWEERPQVLLAGLSPFLVGLLVAVVGLLAWRRRAWQVERSEEGLTFRRRGLFGTTVFQWSGRELMSVSVQEVPTEGFDRYYELNIVLRDGTRHCVIGGRPKEELDTMAWLLRPMARRKPSRTLMPLGVDTRRGHCLVCGDPLVKCTVFCATCSTPHHEECWSYNGQCATFGCGGIRYVHAR
jgi:hypothetical protein